MADIKWKGHSKASDWWYLIGLTGGIGYLAAIIYTLVSDNKNRIWSLFYLLGFIGGIVLYFVFEKSDRKFADMSKKLVIGNIVAIVIALVVFFSFRFFMFHQFWTYSYMM